MKKTPRRKKSKPPERKYTAAAAAWVPFHTRTSFSLLGVGDVAYLTSECLGQPKYSVVERLARPEFRCPFKGKGNYFLRAIPQVRP